MVVADHLVWYLVVFLGVSGSSESIGFAVVLALDQLDPIIEFFDFDGPSGLLWSNGADCLEVLEMSVVCSDLDLVSGVSEVVSPVCKGCHNGEEFLFVDRTVSLDWGEVFGQEAMGRVVFLWACDITAIIAWSEVSVSKIVCFSGLNCARIGWLVNISFSFLKAVIWGVSQCHGSFFRISSVRDSVILE